MTLIYNPLIKKNFQFTETVSIPDVLTLQGTWNADTNTPALTNGVGTTGYVYKCNVAGTTDFGAGDITFAVGDWALYSNGVWDIEGNSSALDSVFGRTGAVVATLGDYAAALIAYSNTLSGLDATTTQAAIDELATRVDDTSGTGIVGTQETWTARVTYGKYTGIVLHLEDTIADTRINVYSGRELRLMLPPEDYVGGKQLTINTDYHSIESGETITIYYNKLANPSTNAELVTLTGAEVTAAVVNDNVQVTFNMTNASVTPETVVFDATLSDGVSNVYTKSISQTVPVGVSAFTVVYNNPEAATYTHTSTAPLAKVVTGITVAAKVAAFTYDNFTSDTIEGDKIRMAMDVTNTGSLSGTTNSYFQLDTGSKIAVSSGTILPTEVVNVGYIYSNLGDATYTAKGFETNQTTQVGSTGNHTISTNVPTALPMGASKCVSRNTNGSYSIYSTNNTILVGDFGAGFSLPRRSWLYFDTSGITGTVLTAKLILGRPAPGNLGTNCGVYYSSYRTGQSAKALYNSSGTSYKTSNGTKVGNQVHYTLNGTAVTAINLNTGIYILMTQSSGNLAAYQALSYLELTY